MKRPIVYTLNGCTIEIAPGGQSATATRSVDADGKLLRPPQTMTFRVLGQPDAPTPQVQAERWAMGEWKTPQELAEVLTSAMAAQLDIPAAHAATEPPEKPKGKK